MKNVLKIEASTLDVDEKRELLRLFEADATDPPQDFYAVDRSGRVCVVPLADLSDAELDAKICLLEIRARQDMEHAKTLRALFDDPSRVSSPYAAYHHRTLAADLAVTELPGIPIRTVFLTVPPRREKPFSLAAHHQDLALVKTVE